MKIKDFDHFMQSIKKIPQHETTARRVYLMLSPSLFKELESHIKPTSRYGLSALVDEGIDHLIQMFGKLVYICDFSKKGKQFDIDYSRTFDL